MSDKAQPYQVFLNILVFIWAFAFGGIGVIALSMFLVWYFDTIHILWMWPILIIMGLTGKYLEKKGLV